MSQLASIGRAFFALAIIGLGAEQFIFDRFVVGRAPPLVNAGGWGVAWAWVSGAVFVLCGAAMLLDRRGRAAALVTAALISGWALVRHVPVVIADTWFAPSWTDAGKALAFTGGGLVVAAVLSAGPDRRGEHQAPWSAIANSRLLTAGRFALGLFLFLTGVQHFIYTEFVASLIPGWFPGGAVGWTYFAGIALQAGGIGLLLPFTARLAAILSGCMVFSWFWIVHLPRTFDGYSSALAVFEALAISGIAFVIAGALSRGRAADQIPASAIAGAGASARGVVLPR
jgi:uncharacterized membrane protein